MASGARWAWLAGGVLVAVSGCDANDTASSTPETCPDCAGGDGNGDGSSGGAGPSPGADAGATSSDPVRSSIISLGDAAVCADVSLSFGPAPSALLVVMDSSGSMQDPGASGSSKWDEMRAALARFASERRSAPLSLGLTFFPQAKPGSSFTCTTQDDCGPEAGPCDLFLCANASSSIFCASDAECPDALEGSCVAVGLCAGAPADSPLACILGTPCEGFGACLDVEHHCTNAARCDADAYAAPSLEITPLADAALALGPALDTRTPEGNSPLGPALQGGITHAAAWQAAHPGESAAVLLVTDALPTTCEPLAVADIAAVAASGLPAVRTFVLGTSNTTTSLEDRNAIARAGGTRRAMTLDPSGDLGSGLDAALEGLFSECRRELDGAIELAFSRVDATLEQPGQQPRSLAYVPNAAACTASGGWFYDTDPALERPGAVEFCPATCELLRTTPDASVRARVACPAPPPAPTCENGQLTMYREPATLMLLVDRSGSQAQPFEGATDRYNAMLNALTAPESPLRRYAGQLRIGATLYTSQDGSGPDPEPRQCPLFNRLGAAYGNVDALAGLLADQGPFGDGPAAESIQAVSLGLAAEPGASLLWLTDSAPDTCEDGINDGSEEAYALTVQALVEARARGVETQLLAIGPDIDADHLAQLATAGSRPERPLSGLRATTTAAFAVALEAAVDHVRCDVALPAPADLDPTRTRVTLDGATLGYGASDGWNSAGPGILHLRGSACDVWRRGTQAAPLGVSCVAK